jgi:hypothetical protein
MYIKNQLPINFKNTRKFFSLQMKILLPYLWKFMKILPYLMKDEFRDISKELTG